MVQNSNIEDHKKKIIRLLEDAAENGGNKTKLGIKSPLSKKALTELLREQKVANLGSSKRPLFVLHQYYKPLEMAYDGIKFYAQKRNLHVFSKNKVEKDIKLPSSVKKKIDEALDLLVQKRELLKIKTGNHFSYIAIAPILELLNLNEKAVGQNENDFKNQVEEAFVKLKQRTGFSAVEIYALQQESGVPLDWLKDYILHQREIGKAELFFGDWSLSTPDIRSAEIEVDGDRFLLVRFI